MPLHSPHGEMQIATTDNDDATQQRLQMQCSIISGCYRIHVCCAADGWHVQTFLKFVVKLLRHPKNVLF